MRGGAEAARRAHNPKVVGSNPAPATTNKRLILIIIRFFIYQVMKIILGLGSNLGKREENLEKACNLLQQNLGKITIKSSIIETKPWGFESQDMFLNSALVIDTDKTPFEALSICLQIEQLLGRVRTNAQTYHSRLIDIDILFYENQIIESSELVIPHPLICKRDFVLIPLKGIIPEFIHPKLNIKIKDIPNPK